MLDTIHHQGLRLALGAFKTSPVESLYVEAGEPSLNLRRNKLSLQYATRISSNSKNPAKKVIFNPKFSDKFLNKPNEIKTIGLRIKNDLDALELNPLHVLQNIDEDIPPWTLRFPEVNLSLTNFKKSETSAETYKEEFTKIREEHDDFIQIYTDGSKDGNKVGCAAFEKSFISNIRLPEKASIFTAEVKAIDLALSYISQHKHTNFIIFSDSLSVLTTIKNHNTDNVLIQNLHLRLHEILRTKTVKLCWIPSHIGIKGNERVDRLAKDALDLAAVNMKLPSTDFRPAINNLIKSKWKSIWDELYANKLHEINPDLNLSSVLKLTNRRDQVVLTRCRIGHTRISHSYLLKREEQPFCIACNEPFTVKHFLLDCHDLNDIRTRYFNVRNLQELFTNIPSAIIINYLKEAGLFQKI